MRVDAFAPKSLKVKRDKADGEGFRPEPSEITQIQGQAGSCSRLCDTGIRRVFPREIDMVRTWRVRARIDKATYNVAVHARVPALLHGGTAGTA